MLCFRRQPGGRDGQPAGGAQDGLGVQREPREAGRQATHPPGRWRYVVLAHSGSLSLTLADSGSLSLTLTDSSSLSLALIDSSSLSLALTESSSLSHA